MSGQHSIVLELQELATDSRNDVADLLRKSLLVATKLKIADFRDWATNELEGYRNGPVPEYRKAYATLSVKNPYHGLVPLVFADTRMQDSLCNVEIPDPIGNLVSLIANQADGATPPVIPFSSEQMTFLMRLQENQRGFCLPPVRTIGITKLASILDAIRTKILNWAMKLEEEGIVGEGATFSLEEKQRASSSTHVHIENFQGVVGDILHSTVTQNLQMTVKQGDFTSLRDYLKSEGVDDGDIGQLEEAVNSDPRPERRGSFGPHVSDWIGKMMTKAACGASQLAIGTAGSLLAQAIWVYYGL